MAAIAGKKTFRRSVDRNRARRRLREAYRLNRELISGSVDIILVARGYLLKSRFQDIEKELLDLASKAGVLSNDDR